MFHNVDIWRRALPANGDPMWSFWPFGQAWMCRNLFDRDKSYLARIWPILRESARFCMDFLSDTEQGLAPSPATSPENCFLVNGKPTSVAQASENATAIVRNLLDDLILAAQDMDDLDGDDESLVQEARIVVRQLAEPQIGTDEGSSNGTTSSSRRIRSTAICRIYTSCIQAPASPREVRAWRTRPANRLRPGATTAPAGASCGA